MLLFFVILICEITVRVTIGRAIERKRGRKASAPDPSYHIPTPPKGK